MSNDDEKYDDDNNNGDNDDEEEFMFGGQVPRAATQVTGLTNIEKSKTLMTLSTQKVNTKPNQHSKPSAYVPSSDLFKFSNPDRPKQDLDEAMNQIYHGQPVMDKQTTFTKPTAARPHGAGSGINSKYAKHFVFKQDGSTEVVFGKLTSKSSCYSLILSIVLAIIFCVVTILFFPKFGSTECDTTCGYSKVADDLIDGVVTHEIRVVGGCTNNNLMFAFNNASNITVYTFDMYTYSELQDIGADSISALYVTGSDTSNAIGSCSNTIENDEDNEYILQGYVILDFDEYVWEWSTTGFFLVLCIIMAFFFVLIEWLFYSYNEIMIPYKDYQSYIMWYLIRMGWMSYMFTVIIAHSFLVSDGDINFIVGSFDYVWVEADCYIATAYIGIFMLICLCCCCFQESDGFQGVHFTNRDEFGCERYFLPQSRMDKLLVNDFEQGLGSAMCSVMVFVIAFIICGFVPFIEFLQGGLAGYANLPYIASIWFLTIIAMTFQMCWFVRARCCADEEDKRKAAQHDNEVQQRGGQPQFNRAATAPSSRTIN